VAVRADDSMIDAARQLASSAASDLMVTDDEGGFVGVLSEGDLIRGMLPDWGEVVGAGGSVVDAYTALIAKGKQLSKSPILPRVITDPITVAPDDHVAVPATILIERMIRRLPVVEDGRRLVGTVSRSDLLRVVTDPRPPADSSGDHGHAQGAPSRAAAWRAHRLLVAGALRARRRMGNDDLLPYIKVNLKQLEDMAPKFGIREGVETRPARGALGLANVGLTHLTLDPGFRVPFGHKHVDQEEVYIVLSGSARMKVDDDILDLDQWDAVHVPGAVMRGLEGGPDGAEILAFGQTAQGKGQSTMVPGWWRK
jgi:CBS domain-containing protein